ncbi:transporter substrate-binding domain-containing protein [Desulfobotulus sp. H1]|uniref:Transporter substrate-binding domain-containing protein n=1 Tax=Desulfobotulus pelophilus TaxID=2823377 RepID=A0ABT3N6R3_9BACT|nr:transporter substrate-binding domain-containing protein [Desulfobotulus pelophilus]MCW7753146.1 transporter substrate-binding domain-containing protein [Desulfobotulus pelophilus]
MKILTKLFFLLFFITALTVHADTEKPLLGATLNWEPYIGVSLPEEGYVAQIVREAFAAGGGYTLDIEFMAWTWVVALAGSGRYDFYFPEYYDAKLEENFLLSDPIPGGPLAFFKRATDHIAYKNLQDLKPYKIGVVRGYVNTPEFDAAHYLTKVESMRDIDNIQKLLSGSVDLIVTDQYVGLYILRTQMPERMKDVTVITPPLEIKDLYVCIPKNARNANERMQAFNLGLQQLKDSGRIREIIASHGF